MSARELATDEMVRVWLFIFGVCFATACTSGPIQTAQSQPSTTEEPNAAEAVLPAVTTPTTASASECKVPPATFELALLIPDLADIVPESTLRQPSLIPGDRGAVRVLDWQWGDSVSELGELVLTVVPSGEPLPPPGSTPFWAEEFGFPAGRLVTNAAGTEVVITVDYEHPVGSPGEPVSENWYRLDWVDPDSETQFRISSRGLDLGPLVAATSSMQQTVFHFDEVLELSDAEVLELGEVVGMSLGDAISRLDDLGYCVSAINDFSDGLESAVVSSDFVPTAEVIGLVTIAEGEVELDVVAASATEIPDATDLPGASCQLVETKHRLLGQTVNVSLGETGLVWLDPVEGSFFSRLTDELTSTLAEDGAGYPVLVFDDDVAKNRVLSTVEGDGTLQLYVDSDPVAEIRLLPDERPRAYGVFGSDRYFLALADSPRDSDNAVFTERLFAIGPEGDILWSLSIERREPIMMVGASSRDGYVLVHYGYIEGSESGALLLNSDGEIVYSEQGSQGKRLGQQGQLLNLETLTEANYVGAIDSESIVQHLFDDERPSWRGYQTTDLTTGEGVDLPALAGCHMSKPLNSAP